MAQPLLIYLLLWALFIPLFFTLAGNVLWTYLLPALPAFACLLALALPGAQDSSGRLGRLTTIIAYLVPVLALAAVAVVLLKPDTLKSEKGMIAAMRTSGDNPASTGATSRRFYYLGKPPFSARFYSRGQAREFTLEALRNQFLARQTTQLAVPKKRWVETQQRVGKPLPRYFENRRYILTELPVP